VTGSGAPGHAAVTPGFSRWRLSVDRNRLSEIPSMRRTTVKRTLNFDLLHMPALALFAALLIGAAA